MLSLLARQSSRIVARASTRITVRQVAPVLSSIRSFRSSLPIARKSSSSPAAAQTAAQEEADAYAEEDGENDEDYEYDENDYYNDAEPEVAFVTKPAPRWQATALVDGKFQELSSNDFLGSWTVLFFYPLDWTFVCPTEIRAFSDRVSEFEKLGAKVVAASVDSEYSHLAWTQQDKKVGGLGPMKIPILADITKSISRSYGVLLEDKGIALRGLFIIDPQGILRQSTVNDLPIGRSVDETLRLVQAFQHHEKNGEVCPAGWKAGDQAMTADQDGLKKYFSKKH